MQHVTLWEKWDGKDWWAVLCFRGLWCVNEDSGGVRVKSRKLWCSSCWCTELLKLSLFQHQWSWSLTNLGLAAEDLPVCGVCSFPDVFVFPPGVPVSSHHHHHHLLGTLVWLGQSYSGAQLQRLRTGPHSLVSEACFCPFIIFWNADILLGCLYGREI